MPDAPLSPVPRTIDFDDFATRRYKRVKGGISDGGVVISDQEAWNVVRRQQAAIDKNLAKLGMAPPELMRAMGDAVDVANKTMDAENRRLIQLLTGK